MLVFNLKTLIVQNAVQSNSLSVNNHKLFQTSWNTLCYCSGFEWRYRGNSIKLRTICRPRRDSNRELHECKSKALQFEPAWSLVIITVWPKEDTSGCDNCRRLAFGIRQYSQAVNFCPTNMY